MCDQLKEIRAAMRVYASVFDASLLSCADATVVVKEAAALEHMSATVKALAAARAAEAKTWKTGGHRSPEEQLAHTTGTTVKGAREALNLGRRLASQPEVATAARQGQLSPTQAVAISDAVAADPSAASGLLEAATAGGSVAELKDRCATIKAAASDLESRRQDIRRHRSLRSWTDQAGVWHLAGQGNPEDGAQIMSAVTALADHAFHTAGQKGRREHPDAYRFDALVQLAVEATGTSDDCETTEVPSDLDRVKNDDCADQRDALGEVRDRHGPDGSDQKDGAMGTRRRRRRKGAPVKLLIRVDLPTLLRGFPCEGETCDLVGYGPLAVSAVNDLIEHGDPFIAAIFTKGTQLVGVAHLGRKPTAHQRSALEWIYPTCAAQGCPTPAQHLEIDHRIDWAQTHITLIDWLDALCPHDHALKTRYGWSLASGVGKRPFVPPSDPRHPRYRPQPGSSK